jgi:hypothetical protein
MRKFLLSAILIFGLVVPIGASHAQSTNTVTATCKDGSTFSGTRRSGACRGHGGVQTWGTAEAPAAPAQATARSTAAVPPGGDGQVWVNTASNVYHCPGTRWYGKTKKGEYMSEAAAKAAGTGRPTEGAAGHSVAAALGATGPHPGAGAALLPRGRPEADRATRLGLLGGRALEESQTGFEQVAGRR